MNMNTDFKHSMNSTGYSIEKLTTNMSSIKDRRQKLSEWF